MPEQVADVEKGHPAARTHDPESVPSGMGAERRFHRKWISSTAQRAAPRLGVAIGAARNSVGNAHAMAESGTGTDFG